MSRAHDADGADHVTPHQLVRDLETSIAARLASVDESRDELARAQAKAAQLITDAEADAAEAAARRAAAIVSAAGATAARLTEEGRGRAAELTEAAARRRDEDVAEIVAAVLPESCSRTEEAS